ncbi:riboflavin synthase [Halomarina pelagica]|uniref:riboflavin synthase n=1 Tax=Halomarina pelagica TaxID=2961599 RepID=UPI0020C4639C|nr:riboflavin synthase [Halomarina sp. BND7]
MFTGIVEETGEVVGVESDEGGKRIRVASGFTGDLDRGESISVSGACLTVEDRDADSFELFLSRETLDRTYLDGVAVGDRVNLERAMPADGRFDGHLVQGHVDGTGEVTRIERVGDDWTFGFSLPASLARYVVEKGSITVDGISLTIAELDGEAGEFAVAIIPATYDLTNLSAKEVGDPIHLEVDVIAKYVERLVREGDLESPLLDDAR